MINNTIPIIQIKTIKPIITIGKYEFILPTTLFKVLCESLIIFISVVYVSEIISKNSLIDC